MSESYLQGLFSLRGQTAVVTGATGALCSEMCRALAQAGARVAVLARSMAPAEALAAEIQAAGGEAAAFVCDVLQRDSLEAACAAVLAHFGSVDILINGAGGNQPGANAAPGQAFFDLPAEALEAVVDLNLLGTLYPCQVFGKVMAGQKRGVILNITSMAAYRPLTRVVAYAAAKAAVSNFTQWLAVHMAKEYSPEIRVNALAPGFLVGKQNRHLLLTDSGELTARGQAIVAHMPQGRFQQPADLIGGVLYLVSPAAAQVTGVVLPVDGGFNAYAGV